MELRRRRWGLGNFADEPPAARVPCVQPSCNDAGTGVPMSTSPGEIGQESEDQRWAEKASFTNVEAFSASSDFPVNSLFQVAGKPWSLECHFEARVASWGLNPAHCELSAFGIPRFQDFYCPCCLYRLSSQLFVSPFIVCVNFLKRKYLLKPLNLGIGLKFCDLC